VISSIDIALGEGREKTSSTGSVPANVTTISALQGGLLNGSASNQSNV
jgi:hypothetical protein